MLPPVTGVAQLFQITPHRTWRAVWVRISSCRRSQSTTPCTSSRPPGRAVDVVPDLLTLLADIGHAQVAEPPGVVRLAAASRIEGGAIERPPGPAASSSAAITVARESRSDRRRGGRGVSRPPGRLRTVRPGPATSSTEPDDAGVKRPEIGETGRRLVEAHGVDGVLEIVGMHAEEGHAPLVVVQPGRTGDQLDDPPGERRPDLPWSIISSFRSSKGRANQLCVVPAPLRHGVEAEGPFALGGQLAVQPGRAGVPRACPGRTRTARSATRTSRATSSPAACSAAWSRLQPYPIRTERHHAQVCLVAEDREGHDLVVVPLGALDRGRHGLGVALPGPMLAEQVDDPPAARRNDC